MRRLFGALLALLLAGPSSAQVRAVAAAVAPVSASAGVPLAYRVQLERGDAAAAGRFIKDVPAMSWFARNRPADLAPMLMAAHQMLDVHAAAGYATDPVQLRRAIQARSDSPLFSGPSRVLGAVGQDPALAPSAPLFGQALLEWDFLKEPQREALTRTGTDAKAWSALSLEQRLEALRKIYEAIWERNSQGLAPGSRRYLELLNLYTTQAGPYFPAQKEAEMREYRQRVEKLHAGLARARAHAAASGLDRLGEAVERISGAQDLTKAETALDALFDAMKPREAAAQAAPAAPAAPAAAPAPETAPRAVPLSNEEFVARASELMPAVMKSVARGTEAGTMLEALDAGPSRTRVVIGKSVAGSSAHYATIDDVIVLNEAHLRAFLRWQKITPEQFLGSPGAQFRFAVLIAPVYVHEATHRRQALASDRKGISRRTRSYLYSQSDEEESFMAQGLIARRLAGKEKVKDFLREAAVAGKELNGLVHHWQMSEATPEQVAAHVRKHYEAVAGEHTARSRAISYARRDAEKLAPFRPAIAAELARRRRLPAVERDALARLPAVTGASPSSAYATGVLRDMARRADPESHAGLVRYYGYLDGLKHARAQLSAAISAPESSAGGR